MAKDKKPPKNVNKLIIDALKRKKPKREVTLPKRFKRMRPADQSPPPKSPPAAVLKLIADKLKGK